DAQARASAGKLRGRVLLVEDNPVNLMVAQRLVGLLGLHCETADNGEKALERMAQGNLDLVLMDCQMPVKDGYTASREWREHEVRNNLPRLPIIAMTANAMAGDRQKCLDAGMDDYLSKPVDRRLLEATVARWLSQRHAAAQPASLPAAPAPAAPASAAPAPAPSAAAPAPVRPAPEPAPAAPRPMAPAPAPTAPTAAPAAPTPPVRPTAPAAAPVRTEPLPATPAPRPAAPVTPAPAAPQAPSAPANPPAPPPPVLAAEVVEELRSVMGAEYLSLVRLFLEDAPGHVRALEAAAAANDMSAMVAPAHTLKSASANLGAMVLSAAAKRIELGARQGVLPRPAVAVAVLESVFLRAEQALRGLLC